MSKRAHFYKQGQGGQVICQLCPHVCSLELGQTGHCQQRQNIDGLLWAVGYGEISSMALDPIEKKPLYHYMPGKSVLSVGGIGCNLRCIYCQNWHISQQKAPTKSMSPSQLVASCISLQQEDAKVVGLAFTYNEPGIWYEYICDVTEHSRQAMLRTVLVTNAYLNPNPFQNLCQRVDALNIDIKGFSDAFYRQIVGGTLDVVKKNIVVAVEHCHVELTYLVIPTQNDDEKNIEQLVRWVASLSPDIPLHLSRYFPNYRLALPPTPVHTLQRLYDVAREYLNFVYVGNLGWEKGQNTYCPHCQHLLLNRSTSSKNKLSGLTAEGRCQNCGQKMPITI